MNCSELRAMAPELAAGAVAGEERAVALAHLAWCAACREEVALLTEAVDRLLLLAPGAEPPVGFESRVVGALGTTPTPTQHRHHHKVLAAAAVVLLLSVGVAVGRVSRGTRPGAPAPVAAVLMAGNGADVGRVVLTKGRPGWLVVDVRGLYGSGAGEYLVELDWGGGRVERSGALRLVAGGGATTIRLGEDRAETLAAVRLVTPRGERECEARFR